METLNFNLKLSKFRLDFAIFVIPFEKEIDFYSLQNLSEIGIRRDSNST